MFAHRITRAHLQERLLSYLYQQMPVKWITGQTKSDKMTRHAPHLTLIAALIPALFLIVILSACSTAPRQTNTEQQTEDKHAKPVLDNKPILQIDTGGHMSIINNIFFTQNGQSLISVSDDKTVRIWDIESGKTTRILRGQIGSGNEGKIFAAALSPDNRLLALGGYLGSFTGNKPREDEGAHKIRLIDLQNGQVLRLLKGHTNVILSLAFSADGRFLLSGSADSTARVWNVASGESLHTLTGHSEAILAVAFSPDGHKVVTGSYDHNLKLWDSTTGLLAADLSGHSDKVRSVAFTPDGKYILSGSGDQTIRLWDGQSGAFIKVLAQQDSHVSSLSISPDSTKVITGSSSWPISNNVFAFPSGRQLTSFSEHQNIVMATTTSPDGATAATGGGSDQEIFLWDIQTGQVKQRMVGQGQIVWSVGFAKDGQSIAWGKEWNTRNMLARGPLEQSFQLRDSSSSFNLMLGETVTPDAAASPLAASKFIRAIESVGELTIGTPDGNNHANLFIKKKGQVIHTITHDSTTGHDHRSYTLTPDGLTVISGGSWGLLTSYDPETGEKLHDFVGHTSDVWAVAASPDSRYLVSGSDDQTVKLWEIDSGKLLLTIFHGNDGEWVAWTPDGFYTASPKGDAYVGYHINRGEDHAADYVGLDQIGKLYYRPDLVAKTVQGGHEQEIVTELARIGSIDKIIAGGLPPEVRLLSTDGEKSRQRNFRLQLAVKASETEIGNIRYFINGVEIASSSTAARGEALPGLRRSGVIEEDETYIEKPLTLPDGTNEISVIACNANNTICSRETKLTRSIDDPHNKRPNLHVLAVGITHYRDRSLQLAFADRDAEILSARLKQQGEGLYKQVHTPIVLLNDDATTSRIKDAFKEIADRVEPNDVFILFLAGHGMAWQGDYHFIPYEAVYEDIETFAQASLSEEKLASLLKLIPTSKSLVILDSCSAGDFASGMAEGQQFAMLAARGLEEKSAIDRLMRATGRHVLAATSERDWALEGYEDHGVFTWALLEGLKGHSSRINQDKGSVSIDDLAEFVRNEVPRVTLKKWGFEQIPMRLIQGDTFPIACKDGYNNPGCRR